MPEPLTPSLRNLPVAATPGSEPPRHETVLSDDPIDVVEATHAAAAIADPAAQTDALRRIVTHHPTALDAWARLSEASLAAGDAVAAYAFARVAYHRGLDRLRREGWGGTGIVRWSRPSNRGFLRGLYALLAAAAAIGEVDESARCREFLLTLDPDDGLDIAAVPPVPGADWTPAPLP